DRFLTQETTSNTPITEMVVNSLILAPEDGAHLHTGQTVEVRGVAWDGGAGIVAVDVSLDNGRTWRAADLGEDLGRFAWRHWRFVIPSARSGRYQIMARATNRLGVSQTHELIVNPAGYHHNVMHRVAVQVA
ncbi:MAG: oxidase, partial [Burkholderiales bacterium]|nr:oxidase [Burkholderiales bacterium]